ncbi:MAG: hypothetical protein CMJ76_11585 [Planctomycetaceae bacterium]|nr:hypothetical protein [Planctomycetaceae bacterium]|tara:strand:+ start:96 stop:497 length:402 start_codon:yes stop_codon:yes gene_type:complete
MFTFSIGLFFVVILVGAILVFVDSLALMLLFKTIDPHLNRDELKLGFTIALKIYGIVYAGMMVVFVVGGLLGQTAIFSIGSLIVSIVGLVLMIKWFELDLGVLILIWLLYGAFNALVSMFLVGLIAGILSIAI